MDLKGAINLGIDDKDYDVEKVENRNLIIIGNSRSGKSTFVNLLESVNHTTSIEVYRGTKEPITKTLLISHGDKKMVVNVIDTPGLNEESDSKRSNFDIQRMISQFVKRDITKVAMILITVNGASGLNSLETASIKELIKFFGPKMMFNLGLLITHCENFTTEDEETWVSGFKSNNKTRFIQKTCKMGVFFTGAISDSQYDNVPVRDKFIVAQKKRNLKFIHSLVHSKSVPLINDIISGVKTMMDLTESSMIEDYQSVRLKEEIKKNIISLESKRLKISTLLEESDVQQDVKAHTNKMLERYKWINGKSLDEIKLIDFNESIRTYRKLAVESKEKFDKLHKMNTEVSDAVNAYSEFLDSYEFHGFEGLVDHVGSMIEDLNDEEEHNDEL
jgi:GTP-binding protein EngB required for normal cell division